MKNRKNLEDLTALVETLRGPGGCPWDREQTLTDLKSFLIGEAYELLEAIDHNNHEHIAEEAGDLLFIIIFLVDLFREKGTFTIYEVIGAVMDKMIRRHPHVFGTSPLKTAQEVRASWRSLKEQEGKPVGGTSILDGVPGFLPGLVQAQLLTHKASLAGFEWDHPGQVLEKIEEELGELRESFTRGEAKGVAAELGDLLFSVATLSRHLHLDAEQVLRTTNKKFTARFHCMEEALRKAGRDITRASLREMEALWEKSKERCP